MVVWSPEKSATFLSGVGYEHNDFCIEVVIVKDMQLYYL